MLDAVATRAQNPAAPMLSAGFDDDFKEIVVVDQGSARVSERQEQDPIFLPCQIHTTDFDKLQQLSDGNSPKTRVDVLVARKDLVAAGKVDVATGEPLIRSSDRLVSIRDSLLNVVHAIRTPPGLYVVEVKPQFGIARGGDFFVFTFADREQFARG